MIKPPPSPIHHGEGESLSEWFCHINSTACQSECSSLSVPFGELSISYMDDVSDTSSYRVEEKDDQGQTRCNSYRGKQYLNINYITEEAKLDFLK